MVPVVDEALDPHDHLSELQPATVVKAKRSEAKRNELRKAPSYSGVLSRAGPDRCMTREAGIPVVALGVAPRSCSHSPNTGRLLVSLRKHGLMVIL